MTSVWPRPLSRTVSLSSLLSESIGGAAVVDVWEEHEEFSLLDGRKGTSWMVRLENAPLRGTRRTRRRQTTRVQSNEGSGGREFESPQPDGKTSRSEPVRKGRLSSFSPPGGQRIDEVDQGPSHCHGLLSWDLVEALRPWWEPG